MPYDNMLREVLASAVYAPSGDNAQPWEFEIGEGNVRIFNTPDSDATLYNFEQRGSYFGHGALIENIALLSSQRGYDVSVEPFPGKENCTAVVSFSAKEPKEEPLAASIKERATNRKPYNSAALAPQHRAALFSAAAERGASLTLVEERADVEKFAKVLSLNERLLMENRPLHDFLFGMIRWSKEEEQNNPGLYIQTMELPPPVRFMFRYVLNHWPLVACLNALGFPKMISRQTASLYQSSSAIGVLTIPSERNEDFLNAGRSFQRIWLAATHSGLALQPVTGLPYLAQRIHAGGGDVFSSSHIADILAAEKKIQSFIPGPGVIAMIFRVGYGDAPSAKSAKLPPVYRTAH